MATFTLSVEAIRRLGEIAGRWGVTRSAALDRLIRDAEMPRRAREMTGGDK
jgi:hypothetical protein